MPTRTCTSLTANTPRGCLVRMGTTPKIDSLPRTRRTTTMTGTGSAADPGPKIATECLQLPCPDRHGTAGWGTHSGRWALDWHQAGTRLSPNPLPSPSSRAACGPQVLGEAGGPLTSWAVTPLLGSHSRY